MSEIADRYRAEILRAVLGPDWRKAEVRDPHRLNLLFERLVDSEMAQAILLARGHGTTGMSFIEIASSVPERPRRILDQVFAPRAPQCDGLQYSPEQIAAFFKIPPDEPPEESR